MKRESKFLLSYAGPLVLSRHSARSPMAIAFFQGTVAQFMAYNAFGQGQAMQPTRPGGGYAPAPAPAENTATQMHNPMNTPSSAPRIA